MKIIHITDIHVRPRGETIYGIDSGARLAAIVDDVNARHADADLVVVTGDLTHHGEPGAYEILAELTERLTVPVRLLLGNHDDRANFRTRFPEAPVDEHGFVQSFIDAPDGIGRLIFLDTHEPGWSGGRFCAQRLDWLDRTLTGASDRPATIFMHHPPLPFGVRHFDKICLHEPEPLLARLRAHEAGIRHLFIGHIHLPLSGVLPGGLPFTAGRGCSHQIVLDAASPECQWASGVPNYNIVELGDDVLYVHSFDKIGAELIGMGDYPAGP